MCAKILNKEITAKEGKAMFQAVQQTASILTQTILTLEIPLGEVLFVRIRLVSCAVNTEQSLGGR